MKSFSFSYPKLQVTKLFGINYDTPTTVQIHTSSSQLSAPGSYMLAPSYSEALLMDPASPVTSAANPVNPDVAPLETEMAPSYSEALLYERARDYAPIPLLQERSAMSSSANPANCECSCHRSEEGQECSKEQLFPPESIPEADEEPRAETPKENGVCRNCLSPANPEAEGVENLGKVVKCKSDDLVCQVAERRHFLQVKRDRPKSLVVTL